MCFMRLGTLRTGKAGISLAPRVGDTDLIQQEFLNGQGRKVQAILMVMEGKGPMFSIKEQYMGKNKCKPNTSTLKLTYEGLLWNELFPIWLDRMLEEELILYQKEYKLKKGSWTSSSNILSQKQTSHLYIRCRFHICINVGI